MLSIFMFRLFIAASVLIVFGCQANDNNRDPSQRSFSKTVKFPTESISPENHMMDSSCKWEQSIVPIFNGDEFISFLHQKCEFRWVEVNVNQGNVKFTLLQGVGIGEPHELEYPPLIIETGNTKFPKEYFDEFYTTAEEHLHCKVREVRPNIWEIRNIGYAAVPKAPPLADDVSDLTYGERSLEIQRRRKKKALLTHEERKLEDQKVIKKNIEHSNKHYKKYEEQSRINRICDNIPYTNYFLFEGEYILTIPKQRMDFLDVTSIEYHKE